MEADLGAGQPTSLAALQQRLESEFEQTAGLLRKRL
jgi:hypothetical protein